MGDFLKNAWDILLFSPFLNGFYIVYRVCQENLGLAVMVLAVLVRLALIPLTKQQMGNANKMKDLKPRLAKLQKKYANNQELLAKEQIKMYKEIGYNPVGCLAGFFVQMFVLLVVVQVIRVVSGGTFEGLYDVVKEFFKLPNGDVAIQSTFWGLDLSKDYIGLIVESGKVPLQGVLFNIPHEIIKYVLAWIYEIKTLPYWLLGVGVGVAQYFSSKFTMYVQGTSQPSSSKKKKKGEMNEEEMAAQMSQSMITIMPLMSVVFTLKYPAVLGLYWLTQTVMSMIQYVIIDKEKSLQFFREMLPGVNKKLNFKKDK